MERGCIQRSYRPGKGGIIVFDDGDITEEMTAERDAYSALAEMPDIRDEGDAEIDEDDENDQAESHARNNKRKSWSDQDNEDIDSDEGRPRQRRRSNSGSSISSTSREDRSSSAPSPSSMPAAKSSSPKPPSAKALRRRLLTLRRSHEKVLDEYLTLGTSYSEPISSMLYSLASEMGREDNDLLWLTIVGVSSLELSGHTSTGLGPSATNPPRSHFPYQHHQSWRSSRSSRTYALLRDEVRRLNPPPHDSSPSLPPHSFTASSPIDTTIRLSPDPKFLLLRHWSLYESMLHSPYLSSRLKIWNEAGVKRLHKLLAKMGISLSQCRQSWTHMDMDLKKTLRDRLLRYAGVYGLEDIVPDGNGSAAYQQEGWGFIRSWGWKAQLSAMDVGVIVGAILEVGLRNPAGSSVSRSSSAASQQVDVTEEFEDRSIALLPRFFNAFDALAPNQPSHLLASIPLAQNLMKSILTTGTSLLAKHQIRHLRAFRMGVVKEGPDLHLFANSPGALVRLALWVAEAVAVNEKERKGSDGATPLVLAALDEVRGSYVVVGTGGGMGTAPDLEARKERAEARTKKQKEREQKRKIKEEKRAATALEKAARQSGGRKEEDDDDDEEEEEESEEESEGSSDNSDDEAEDEAVHEKRQKRGHGSNRFGIAFQEVVEETAAEVKIDSFDHCVVEVKKEDLGGFLEGLSLKSVIGR